MRALNKARTTKRANTILVMDVVRQSTESNPKTRVVSSVSGETWELPWEQLSSRHLLVTRAEEARAWADYLEELLVQL